jgi:predicted Rossmann fold nucleotide-binding protein DprA/Smf involved in DNA uptake
MVYRVSSRTARAHRETLSQTKQKRREEKRREEKRREEKRREEKRREEKRNIITILQPWYPKHLRNQLKNYT